MKKAIARRNRRQPENNDMSKGYFYGRFSTHERGKEFTSPSFGFGDLHCGRGVKPRDAQEGQKVVWVCPEDG